MQVNRIQTLALLRLTFLSICFVIGILATGFAQVSVNSNTDSTKVIKLTEIQIEYERVISEIPVLVQKYADSTILQSLEHDFELHSQLFISIKLEADNLLNGYVRSWQIKNLEAKLNRSYNNFLTLSNNVNSASSEIETSIIKVNNLLSGWLTLEKRIKIDTISQGLLPQTQEVISLLTKASKLLQGQFAKFLVIQSQINQFEIENIQYNKKIEDAEHDSFTKLFKRDANYIWNDVENEQYQKLQKSNFIENFKQGTNEALGYLSEKWKTIIWLIILGTILYSVFYFVKKRQSFDNEEPPELLVHNAVIKYPIASSFITILLVTIFVLEDRPALLSELLLIGFVIPLTIFSFGKSVTSPWVYWIIFLLYCVNVILLHIPFQIGLKDFLFVFMNLVASGLLFWMYRNPQKYLSNNISEITGYIKSGLIPFLFYLSGFTLVAALVGYLELAKLLFTGIIGSLYLGPVILICSLIIRNFLQTLSHTFLFEHSFLAKKYLPLAYNLISIGAFILWLSTVMKVFGIYPFFIQTIENFWNFSGEFGEFNISIGDVASVILTIVIAFILSDFIKVLLEEELFSRFKVARGVPMAMGVLGKYIIITLGFFLAIASTGFDLTKMSIIAGALGVGVGFGLQNLVANFVSGMILIFERPILVGDIIEAEGLEGTVSQIGIRSSKIITYSGAEVIIPNSNLINNKVSNWTLSNKKRRFMFKLKTNKNADPAEVVATITTIALQNNNVLKDPAPFVIFQGQQEQSLIFDVYYWQTGEVFITRSELNIDIYNALKAKGIEISIPTIELKTLDGKQ